MGIKLVAFISNAYVALYMLALLIRRVGSLCQEEKSRIASFARK